jgi:hypothetical protein
MRIAALENIRNLAFNSQRNPIIVPAHHSAVFVGASLRDRRGNSACVPRSPRPPHKPEMAFAAIVCSGPPKVF